MSRMFDTLILDDESEVIEMRPDETMPDDDFSRSSLVDEPLEIDCLREIRSEESRLIRESEGISREEAPEKIEMTIDKSYPSQTVAPIGLDRVEKRRIPEVEISRTRLSISDLLEDRISLSESSLVSSSRLRELCESTRENPIDNISSIARSKEKEIHIEWRKKYRPKRELFSISRDRKLLILDTIRS